MYFARLKKQREANFFCSKHDYCETTTALLKATQLLLQALRLDSLMSLLQPEAFLIGSVAEGTRLYDMSEIDVTLKFKRLNEQPFDLDPEDGFHLLFPSEDHILLREGFVATMPAPEGGEVKKAFDYVGFLHFLLRRIKAALNESYLLPDWPTNLFMVNEWGGDNCAGCRKETAKLSRSTTFAPSAHCSECRPAVTHTKIGPCLILTRCQDAGLMRTLSQLRAVTIDLIPVFPVKSPGGLMPLFHCAISSLLNR